jgi:hypothetical protein
MGGTTEKRNPAEHDPVEQLYGKRRLAYYIRRVGKELSKLYGGNVEAGRYPYQD